MALTVQFLHEDLKTAETLFSPGEHPTSFRPGTRREPTRQEEKSYEKPLCNIGRNNIALGNYAGGDLTTGGHNITIGSPGLATEDSTIRIGNQGTQTATYLAGIWQAAITGSAAPVRVNSSGKLGTMPSSARFKEAIKPMDEASEAILSLQPVSFRYKKELDPNAVPQFGLIAEEVAQVAPHLVIADDQGRPFSVRYEEVNAMLLNEFLKEHKKSEQQASEIADLRSTLQDVMARLEARGL